LPIYPATTSATVFTDPNAFNAGNGLSCCAAFASSRLGFEVGLLANAAQYEWPLPALKAFGSVNTVGGFVAGSMLTSWTAQAAQLPVVVHNLLLARKISVGLTRPLTSIPLSVRVPV